MYVLYLQAFIYKSITIHCKYIAKILQKHCKYIAKTLKKYIKYIAKHWKILQINCTNIAKTLQLQHKHHMFIDSVVCNGSTAGKSEC